MALNLKHQTTAQFVARFKAMYRRSSRERRARMAHWLYNRFAAGDITQVQIRTAFNLDTTEKWTTFRDKVMALRDHWQAIQEAEADE